MIPIGRRGFAMQERSLTQLPFIFNLCDNLVMVPILRLSWEQRKALLIDDPLDSLLVLFAYASPERWELSLCAFCFQPFLFFFFLSDFAWFLRGIRFACFPVFPLNHVKMNQIFSRPCPWQGWTRWKGKCPIFRFFI